MKHKHPIPLGWAVGPDGKATTDSKLAFEIPLWPVHPLVGQQEAGDLSRPMLRLRKPDFFAPGYQDRMIHLMKYLRNMNP
ncbi:hypothetical protein Cfor_04089, partial [Coptotermes formosanus]